MYVRPSPSSTRCRKRGEAIKTRVPQECAVRLIDLPYNVDELVSVDEEGFASIYLNARHSHKQQRMGLRHALRHLAGDDFYNDKDIRTVEREADGRPQAQQQAEPCRNVYRDMATLRRLGILAVGRDDPLLNLPGDYDW